MRQPISTKTSKSFGGAHRAASISTAASGGDLEGALCDDCDVSSCADPATPFRDTAQTLIFLDWDDTLFPTTQIFSRWGMPSDPINSQEKDSLPPILSAEQVEMLEAFQDSLRRFLRAARHRASVVIVTNAKLGWVEECLQRFVPDLLPLFSEVGAPKVVYAREFLAIQRRKKRLPTEDMCTNPVRHSNVYSDNAEEWQIKMQRELSLAKYEAMRFESDLFFKGQITTCRNIISMGDMEYEHEAVQELGMTMVLPEDEELRVKSLLLPEDPSLTELSIRLDLIRLLLPACIHAQHDFFLNLKVESNETAMQALSQALQLPALSELNIPAHAWGFGKEPSEREVAESLMELAAALRNEVQA